jgi:hypothetical protein
MRTRTIIGTAATTLCAAVMLTVLGGTAFVYSGFYNVAATDPHWPLTHWVIETGRMRSIQAHAVGITTPPGLDDRQRILVGTEHFAAHCAVCHGAPGVPRGDIANGLYPARQTSRRQHVFTRLLSFSGSRKTASSRQACRLGVITLTMSSGPLSLSCGSCRA